MSRQPPESALQFGRQNRVRLAGELAQEAIAKAMLQGLENLPPIFINADVPDMELPFNQSLNHDGDLE